jgi:hypothetical protein
MTPSSGIAGTWAEVFSIPGASLVLNLDGQGDGAGTYAIEAGRSGSVSVGGSVTASVVTLTVRYDYGLTQTFVGTLADSSHLVGTFGDTGQSVTFVRR